MKKEYDFSKGERGKFHKDNLKINLPIYLEPQTLTFVQNIAKKKKTDLSTVVNKILKNEMKMAGFIK